MQKNIKQLTFDELSSLVTEQLNQPAYRAKQLWQWLWIKNVQDFELMTNLPKQLRQTLAANFYIPKVKIFSFVQSKIDFSIKYTFQLPDNLLIEGVLIPNHSKDRITACISTQVGCAVGCKFCATGTMGLKRNLLAHEIYDHLWLLNQQSIEKFGKKLSNIVVMGMGEPLMNLENTLLALEIITDPKLGMNFSPQRITLSTVGIVKKLYTLADYKPKFNLAISLHSAIQHKREQIIPISKTNTITKLIEALKYYHKQTGQRITFEYLMLGNFNDSVQDAKALAQFTKNFPSKINLIEYNPVPFANFQKSSPNQVQQFINFLKNKNLVVTYRKSKGSDISAACGQLVKNLSSVDHPTLNFKSI